PRDPAAQRLLAGAAGGVADVDAAPTAARGGRNRRRAGVSAAGTRCICAAAKDAATTGEGLAAAGGTGGFFSGGGRARRLGGGGFRRGRGEIGPGSGGAAAGPRGGFRGELEAWRSGAHLSSRQELPASRLCPGGRMPVTRPARRRLGPGTPRGPAPPAAAS